MNAHSIRRRSTRAVAAVTNGAETAARKPGIVIISPAIPSETVKSAPTDVSSPTGRISVVTSENSPAITETTAIHDATADRADDPPSCASTVSMRVVSMPRVQQRRGPGAGGMTPSTGGSWPGVRKVPDGELDIRRRRPRPVKEGRKLPGKSCNS
jgi:hypothetical protein